MKNYKLKIAISVCIIVVNSLLLYISLTTEIKEYKLFCALLFILTTLTAFVLGALLMAEDNIKQKDIKLPYHSDI